MAGLWGFSKAFGLWLCLESSWCRCAFSLYLWWMPSAQQLQPLDENADVDGLYRISEICPALSLKCQSSFVRSLRLEQRFGAGREPQSVYMSWSFGNCSSKGPTTANCTWIFPSCLWTLFHPLLTCTLQWFVGWSQWWSCNRNQKRTPTTV